MTKLKAILLGVLLAISTGALAHVDNDAYNIRNAICRATQWEECRSVDVPVAVMSTKIVLVAQQLWFRNQPVTLMGFFYPGERYIYVRTDKGKERMWETVVHESIHYYYDNTRERVGGDAERCESEYFARYYTTKVLGTEYDTTWYIRYDCQDYKNAQQP